MTLIKGTNVSAMIVPNTTEDSYPTHDSIYGRGGWKEVVTLDERDAIPTSRLKDGTICYVAEYDTPTSIFPPLYKWLDGAWVEASLGGGVYKPMREVINSLGGVDSGSDFSDGITNTDLFNKIFFPNYGKEMPSSPIYFGFMEAYPTIQTIKALSIPSDYDAFNYNSITGEGYIVIALPSTLYLSKIEDINGMNLVNCFDLIYKPVMQNGNVDIYNVYVSPKLFYDGHLRLAYTTKPGEPVQVSLDGGEFSVNDVIPVLNSVSIEAKLELFSVSIAAVTRSAISSVSIAPVTRSVLNSILITN